MQRWSDTSLQAQEDGQQVVQTYHISRQTQTDNLLGETRWTEIWQTRTLSGDPLEIVVINAEVSPDSIAAQCHQFSRNSAQDSFTYLIDGLPEEGADPEATLDALVASLMSERHFVSEINTCSAIEIRPRGSINAEFCQFELSDFDASNVQFFTSPLDAVGERWNEHDSEQSVGELISYNVTFVGSENNALVGRYEYAINPSLSAASLALECLPEPLPLPQGSTISHYNGSNYAVIQTPPSTDLRNEIVQSMGQFGLVGWRSLPTQSGGTTPLTYLTVDGVCRMNVTFFTSAGRPSAEFRMEGTSVSEIEIADAVRDATGQSLEASSSSAASRETLSGKQQLSGNVSENAASLIQSFQNKGWIVNSELTIEQRDEAIITMLRNNYALHIILENVGPNRIQATYQTRIAACGSTFPLP